MLGVITYNYAGLLEVLDLFQLTMSTFSTRALIFGHHGTGAQIDQPNFEEFFKLNNPVHNLLFGFCTELILYRMYLRFWFLMRAHFVSSVFCICPKKSF